MKSQIFSDWYRLCSSNIQQLLTFGGISLATLQINDSKIKVMSDLIGQANDLATTLPTRKSNLRNDLGNTISFTDNSP